MGKDNFKIAIIGSGNLGTSIALGLIKSKFIEPKNIILTKRNIGSLSKIKDVGFEITADNLKATESATFIILAVKPFQIEQILKDIKPKLSHKHCLISVVSSYSLQAIQEQIQLKIPIYRAMPNLAIAIQESMTCLCGINTNLKLTSKVQNLFKNLGICILIDEQLMNAATVIGSCGIAFAMRYLRATIQGGIDIGFNADIVKTIAAQTFKGAAELILKTGAHPESEIDRTTTPKGCTIAGLNTMEYDGFSPSLIKGIKASYDKLNSPDFIK
ncbi:MAG: pyrroline-5-carboxylate reductase [Alphaproteobacteria bacterium]|nr:pyrroline-5-carboxylate reductase [Alphaproteobacteria bacterium]